ncbi:DUF4157 domain-containing protein [Candidatus Zixiibacteriota bacterium]
MHRIIGNQAVGRLLTDNSKTTSGKWDQSPLESRPILKPGKGQPLDPTTQTAMESRFGYDFSDVRVHTDSHAAISAKMLNAKAYTINKDIVIERGRYTPEDNIGKHLLAHELAHVIQQQRGGSTAPSMEPNSILEQGADRAAASFTKGSGHVSVVGASAPGLARQVAAKVKNFPSVTDKSLKQQAKAIQNPEPVPNVSGIYILHFAGQSIQVTHADLARIRGEFRRAVNWNIGQVEADIAGGRAGHEHMAQIRKEHWIVSRVSDWAGDVEFPPLSMWNEPERHIQRARAAMDAGSFELAAGELTMAEFKANDARRRFYVYREGTISGAGTAITTLERTRDAAFTINAVLATVATGGAAAPMAGFIAAGTPVVAEVAQQTTELQLGLRDRIEWGKIGLNALIGIITARFGSRLGSKLYGRLVGRAPEFATMGQKAIARIVSNLMIDKAAAAFQTSANAAYDAATGKDITMDEFLNQLTARLLDPKEAFYGILMGEIGHRAGTRRTPIPPKTTAAPPPKSAPPPVKPTPKPKKTTPEGKVIPFKPAPSKAKPSGRPPSEKGGELISLAAERQRRQKTSPHPTARDVKTSPPPGFEPTAHPPAGEVKTRRPRGFESGRHKPGRRVKAGTLEGLEPTAHPPTRKPSQKGPTRQEQIEGITPRRSRRRRASPRPFMNAVRRQISKPDHPLHFLLKRGNWTTTTRITKKGKLQRGRYSGGEEGPIVQAGHMGAYASGARQRFMIEDADLNIMSGRAIESRKALSFKKAVVIEGVPVDIASALQWERLGLLAKGTVARSPKIDPPEIP